MQMQQVISFVISFVNNINPTRRGTFKAPPPNKNGNFSTFFGPIEPKKFDFSYKPIGMPPKPFSKAFLFSAVTISGS